MERKENLLPIRKTTISLVCFVDNTDNTKGTICATDLPLPHAAIYTTEAQRLIKHIEDWISTQDNDLLPLDVYDLATQVIGSGQCKFGDYTLFIEKTSFIPK